MIELKDGRMNEIISSMIEQRKGALSEDDLETLRTQFGRPAKQQANGY